MLLNQTQTLKSFEVMCKDFFCCLAVSIILQNAVLSPLKIFYNRIVKFKASKHQSESYFHITCLFGVS